ncbi:MAG: hypothetical protein M9918_08195 [Anaerolineae bacterium]|nr:hypothetical protein [Anaerolineae bacterium]
MNQPALLIEDNHSAPTADPISITVRDLTVHPGHDRTRFNLAKLAGLCLQIIARGGIDPTRPVVAAENADGDGTWQIISGYRRYVAQVLAYGVREWVDREPERIATEGGLTLGFVEELVLKMITTFGRKPAPNGHNGSIANGSQPLLSITTDVPAAQIRATVAALLQVYGERDIQIVPFSGSLKQQLLTLQSDNAGAETPDKLGQAHSFKAAYEAGATPQEIARHSGMKLSDVLNLLALTQVPPAIAEACAAGSIGFGVVTALAALKSPRKDGVADFVLSAFDRQDIALTVERVKKVCREIGGWPGITPPLTYAKQAQRNVARCLTRLWTRTVTDNPGMAWTAAAEMAYCYTLDAPWVDPDLTRSWLRLLDTDHRYITAQGEIQWQHVIADLLTEVTCATCPVNQLPQRQLTTDIGEGRGGATGIPCRTATRAEHGNCLHGFAPGDAVSLPVPFSWAEHPGVTGSGGIYTVTSAETLQQAWQAQAALEWQESSVVFPAAAILFPVVVAGDHVPEPWTLYRTTADIEGESLSGYYAERPLAGADSARPDSAERVQSDVAANTALSLEQVERTPTLRTIQDVQDAIQYADITPAQPTIMRPKMSVHSFLATDAVQPAPDRTVQPGEIPGSKAFYEEAPDWRLVISLRHNGVYLYGEQKSAAIPTRTRGHDSVDGVLEEIAGKDEGGRMKDETGEEKRKDEGGGRKAEEERQRAEGERRKAEREDTDSQSLAPDAPSPPSLTSTQRQIADYMQTHTSGSTTHPFATPCARCRHKLTQSPVKGNKHAPPCAWAKGRRNLRFTTLKPADGYSFGKEGLQPIPICHQYAPVDTAWKQLIPAYAGKDAPPRAWLIAQIQRLSALLQRDAYTDPRSNVTQRGFEFLTGRPMGSNESHSDWFEQRFAESVGDLSDAQLMTLFIWCHSEHERLQQHSAGFLLPVSSGAQQFVRVREEG